MGIFGGSSGTPDRDMAAQQADQASGAYPHDHCGEEVRRGVAKANRASRGFRVGPRVERGVDGAPFGGRTETEET